MKILITASSFHYLTGSELYVYELARELGRFGHEVTVAAHRTAGAMAPHAKEAGIRTIRFEAIPQSMRFDLIHANQPGPTKWALGRFPTTPILCTIHSQFAVEQPVIDQRIHHYVCIRPEVQDKIVYVDRVPREKTSVVYNPIDFNRFKRSDNPKERSSPPRVLFCGTIDQLRKHAIGDLVKRAVNGQIKLQLLGLKADNYDGYIEKLHENVSWHSQTWDVAPFIHECDETAGVFLGRTTIEGWACGKPGWIYDLDTAARVRSRVFYPAPLGHDMDKFDSRRVVGQLLDLYCAALSARSAIANA
jgi:hypothetical protein